MVGISVCPLSSCPFSQQLLRLCANPSETPLLSPSSKPGKGWSERWQRGALANMCSCCQMWEAGSSCLPGQAAGGELPM